MRELKGNEYKHVSGAAWWSASNILNLIREISKTPSEPIDWTSNTSVPSNGYEMGEVIGKGITVLAIAAVGISVVAGMSVAGVAGIASAAYLNSRS